MTDIHIATPDGRKLSYPEDQIRRMWQENTIAESVLYWKEGMAEWRPIREFIEASGILNQPPPLSTQPPVKRFSFTKDPSGLTTFVKTMLWISLGVGVISLLSDFGQLSLVSSIESGVITQEAVDSNDARQKIIGIASLVTFIITGIGFLKWIYRANLNSRGFGAKDMKFTSGWSIGYYFIPILCLVRPYQVMKEIWQVSANPQHWKNQSGSMLLGWWWTLWLISNVLGQVSFRLAAHVTDVSSLVTATWASILDNIVEIPLCLVAISLISTIFQRQKAIVE